MNRQHRYSLSLDWTGNLGNGTSDYRSYSRNHTIVAPGKPLIAGSSDPTFRGDRACYNPEELLVASLSACHMLWYLHLCAEAGVVVSAYHDRAEGVMQENPDGSGQFIEVLLKPIVTVETTAMIETAIRLHHDAEAKCFIANSVNFPVHHVPEIQVSIRK